MMNALHLQQFYNAFTSSPSSSSHVLTKVAHSSAHVTSSPHPLGFSFLSALSYDALVAIFSFLTVRDLGILSQVSKDVRHLAEDDFIWRQLCKTLEVKWTHTLSRPLHLVPKIWARPSEWKRAYQVELGRIALAAKFVGLWSEKWCDVNVQQSTLIESDGRNWSVTYKKNKFTATFREFDPSTDMLTFHLEGGDSGWSFIYKIKPISEHQCQLNVFRIHDQKTFAGDFNRCEPVRRGVDNAMGTHL